MTISLSDIINCSKHPWNNGKPRGKTRIKRILSKEESRRKKLHGLYEFMKKEIEVNMYTTVDSMLKEIKEKQRELAYEV